MSHLKRFFLRRIASHRFLWVLAGTTTFLLHEDLIYPLVLRPYTTRTPFDRLSLALLTALCALTVFVIFHTHADELLRRLTLTLIREPRSYLTFMHAFIHSRWKLRRSYLSPLRLQAEIDHLFRIASTHFGIHDRRSLVLLLGIDLVQIKRDLDDLDTHIREFRALPRQHRAKAKRELKRRIKDARKSLEDSIVKPLQYLVRKSPTLKTHYLDILLLFWSLAKEPSYDQALDRFGNTLHRLLVGLEDFVSVLTPQVSFEVSELHSLFQRRGRARLGYPLFEFINHKMAGALDSSLTQLSKGGDSIAMRAALNRATDGLAAFRNVRTDSQQKLEGVLSGGDLGRWDPKSFFDVTTDIICVYGLSRSVVSALVGAVYCDSKKSRVEIVLLETKEYATTLGEEQYMRDQLLDRGFTNLCTLSVVEMLQLRSWAPKKLTFVLGIEAINPTAGEAAFHFGAGQILQRLITELRSTPHNLVDVYLIGATYKSINDNLGAIGQASVFECRQCKWVNEDGVVVFP